MNTTITVQTTVDADIATVWDCWTNPAHIVGWNFASDDWECPAAQNDVREGGRFVITMSAKDKSMSFDFSGVYARVDTGALIEYATDDKRMVSVVFQEIDESVVVTETFEMEHENSEELQRAGWQAILDNFKKYTEQV